MSARLRPLVLAASVVLATIAAPAATGGAVACAAEGPHAGLVVDTGARVIELCVALDAPEVSGLRLIELASAQHGLSYGFGMGGAAVCRLDGVGAQGDDCFAEYPEYWGYWHGDGGGGWVWASTGAGSYRVGDGDIEGWVWGAGDTGASHREPPPLAIDDVCEPVVEPTLEPTRDPKPSAGSTTSSPRPAASPGGETGPPSSDAHPSPDATKSDRPSEDHTGEPSPTVTPSPSSVSSSSEAPAMALGGPPPSDGGPPAGLFVAGALALLLAGGGWFRLRSRARGAA